MWINEILCWIKIDEEHALTKGSFWFKTPMSYDSYDTTSHQLISSMLGADLLFMKKNDLEQNASY